MKSGYLLSAHQKIVDVASFCIKLDFINTLLSNRNMDQGPNAFNI